MPRKWIIVLDCGSFCLPNFQASYPKRSYLNISFLDRMNDLKKKIFFGAAAPK